MDNTRILEQGASSSQEKNSSFPGDELGSQLGRFKLLYYIHNIWTGPLESNHLGEWENEIVTFGEKGE